jgi:hypothetical protein
LNFSRMIVVLLLHGGSLVKPRVFSNAFAHATAHRLPARIISGMVKL